PAGPEGAPSGPEGTPAGPEGTPAGPEGAPSGDFGDLGAASFGAAPDFGGTPGADFGTAGSFGGFGQGDFGGDFGGFGQDFGFANFDEPPPADQPPVTDLPPQQSVFGVYPPIMQTESEAYAEGYHQAPAQDLMQATSINLTGQEQLNYLADL